MQLYTIRLANIGESISYIAALDALAGLQPSNSSDFGAQSWEIAVSSGPNRSILLSILCQSHDKSSPTSGFCRALIEILEL